MDGCRAAVRGSISTAGETHRDTAGPGAIFRRAGLRERNDVSPPEVYRRAGGGARLPLRVGRTVGARPRTGAGTPERSGHATPPKLPAQGGRTATGAADSLRVRPGPRCADRVRSFDASRTATPPARRKLSRCRGKPPPAHPQPASAGHPPGSALWKPVPTRPLFPRRTTRTHGRFIDPGSQGRQHPGTGSLCEPRRHDDRVFRLLHLRHCGGPRLPRALLPGNRPRLRHAGLARHIWHRLPRAAVRFGTLRTFR